VAGHVQTAWAVVREVHHEALGGEAPLQRPGQPLFVLNYQQPHVTRVACRTAQPDPQLSATSQ